MLIHANSTNIFSLKLDIKGFELTFFLSHQSLIQWQELSQFTMLRMIAFRHFHCLGCISWLEAPSSHQHGNRGVPRHSQSLPCYLTCLLFQTPAPSAKLSSFDILKPEEAQRWFIKDIPRFDPTYCYLCLVFIGSVSQPFKVCRALEIKFSFLAFNIKNFNFFESTSRLLGEHLWSLEQWLGIISLR